MTVLTISGYEQDCNCEHCGRTLKHGIKLSDGRLVGAQCLNKQMSAPRVRNGKKYRYGAEFIIRVAKVVQFKDPSQWSRYGVSQQSTVFETV